MTTTEQGGRLEGGAAASILAATSSLKEGAEERADQDADAHAGRQIAQREANGHADRHTDPEPYGDPCTPASVAPHPSPQPRRVSHSGRLGPVAGQDAAPADTETEATR